MINMYAVFLELDGKKNLCKQWLNGDNLWIPALFYSRKDAEIYEKKIKSLKGFEIYKYSISLVQIDED